MRASEDYHTYRFFVCFVLAKGGRGGFQTSHYALTLNLKPSRGKVSLWAPEEGSSHWGDSIVPQNKCKHSLYYTTARHL